MAKNWVLDPTTKTVGREVKVDPRDRIEVVVGDDKQPDFKPQFKLMRWDNEVNFSMRAEEHPEARIEVAHGIAKYVTPNYEVHQYEKPEVDEDGGFEFEWVLPFRPPTPALIATIQMRGLECFQQVPLTSEEIAEGASRPENVDWSYMFRHSTKGGMNRLGGKDYRTGKAFHIYRPKATDAVGKQVWCDLHIDQALGLLTVVMPLDFWASAVYPVTVDPTFGYSTVGGSTFNATSGIAMWCSIVGAYVATTGDIVTSMSIYGERSGGSDATANMAPFTVVAGVVSTQLGVGVGIVIGSGLQWWTTGTTSRALTGGVQYGTTIDPGSNSWDIRFDAGSPPGRFNSTLTSLPGDGGSFSPTGTDSGRQYSIYATYTAAGGAIRPRQGGVPFLGGGQQPGTGRTW